MDTTPPQHFGESLLRAISLVTYRGVLYVRRKVHGDACGVRYAAWKIRTTDVQRGARTRQLEALKDRWTAGSPESGAAASRALLEAVAQTHRLATLSRELQGLPPVDASRSARVRTAEQTRAAVGRLRRAGLNSRRIKIDITLLALRWEDLKWSSLPFRFGPQI